MDDETEQKPTGQVIQIDGEHPYGSPPCVFPCVFPDGIVMKRAWAGEVRNVSLLVAIGVNGEGNTNGREY